MWLTSSSIGRKFVMALTGICLVLFVTFHVLMNAVALIWPAAYNQICMFLGANWYALIASAGLALLFIIHIIYALWLTVQNRKARGNDRYAVNAPIIPVWNGRRKTCSFSASWFSHSLSFTSCSSGLKCSFRSLCLMTSLFCPRLTALPAAPEFGTLFLQAAFENWWTPVIYIVGFAALWFHMNHGFWSMFQTIGWNGSIWLPRLKNYRLLVDNYRSASLHRSGNPFHRSGPQQILPHRSRASEQYAEYWNERALLLPKVPGRGFCLNQADLLLQQHSLQNGDYYSAAQKLSAKAVWQSGSRFEWWSVPPADRSVRPVYPAAYRLC